MDKIHDEKQGKEIIIKNPDVYLLYEYMEKLPLTVRMKIILDAPVDAALLTKAAQEAISRFPYFSVKVGLDVCNKIIMLNNYQITMYKF